MAAPGPSLTEEVAEQCFGLHVIAVNDAHRLFPFAEILYCNGADWWDYYGGVPGFAGEKWSSHSNEPRDRKDKIAEKYSLRLVRGKDAAGFSFDPAVIHYGDNSGFQALNIAGHKIGWRGKIILVGFDMRMVGGVRHFFGNHPDCMTQTGHGYTNWPKKFAEAKKTLPRECKIINCTPDSALTCFDMMPLEKALCIP